MFDHRFSIDDRDVHEGGVHVGWAVGEVEAEGLLLESAPVEDALDGGDGHLDFVAVRFARGEALHPHTRDEEKSGQRVIMRADEAQHLEADAGDDRNQDDPAEEAHPEGVDADHHEQQDGDQHDIDDEAGATALVLLAGGGDIIHRQREAVLDTVDALMLRTVVLEGTRDVRRAGDHFNIDDKEQHTNHALDETEQRCMRQQRLQEAGDPGRKDHEEEHRDHEGKDHDDRFEHRLELIAEGTVQPGLEFRRLLFRLLRIILEEGRTEGEAAHAEHHGIHERKDAADQRCLQEGMLIRHGDVRILHHRDGAIRLPDPYRIALAVPHHHPLDDGLTTDATVDLGVWDSRCRAFI